MILTMIRWYLTLITSKQHFAAIVIHKKFKILKRFLIYLVFIYSTLHELTLLALFEVSSALDRVDHNIPLQHLETSMGLKGLPLCLFQSCLFD